MGRPKKPWIFDKIIEVEWRDSIMSSGWNDPTNYGKDRPTLCRSVGYLLSESKDHVQLVISQDPECDNVNGAITIPKESIVRRRRIR